jgi:8-oxo-dGTP diphosphatase
LKSIEVVAAVLHKDGKILATQRGYGNYKGFWEFPGGKMEPGETQEAALKRELREELNIKIRPERLVKTVEYDYPEFHLTMHCYLASIEDGKIELLEHEDARWLSKPEFNSVPWLAADIEVIEELKRIL